MYHNRLDSLFCQAVNLCYSDPAFPPMKRPSAQTSKQLRPWRQDRSAATVERVVKATMRMLSERDFDSLSVDEIVKASRTSKGAFYFRFETKAHLLRHLAEITYEKLLHSVNQFFTEQSRRNCSLRNFIRAFVDHVAGLYADNRNLLRAFLKEDRPGGDEVVIALVRNGSSQTARKLTEMISTKRDEIHHPHPDRAVIMVAMMLGTMLRQAFLFPERKSSRNLSDREVAEEIKRIAIRYLSGRSSEPRNKASGP